MKILSSRIMRQAEQAVIDTGSISSAALMDKAIESCCMLLAEDPQFRHAADRYPCAVIYAGKGKNAGDAIGLAHACGFRSIILREAAATSELPPETLHQLRSIPHGRIRKADERPILPPQGALIIDGLLGSGAKGALRPEYEALVQELNSLRSASPRSLTLAIDIPTGLQSGQQAQAPIVQADATLAIGCVKPELVADGAEDYVGRLLCAPLPEVPLPDSSAHVLDDSALQWLPHRAYSCFKNRAGKVRIIAGSTGFIGAAQMCAEAALATGAGLVELYCKPDIYPILATRVKAEVMVRPVQSYAEISAAEADALLIGPGLGQQSDAEAHALHKLLQSARCPVVLDADGLNLAAARKWSIPTHSVLTPHPGEMRRLFPRADRLTRAECAAIFLEKTPCTLLLKGARTLITDGTHTCYNSTGGPYMANGGQGDVLSGVIAALLAQKIKPFNAAALGAYLCGRAATAAYAANGFPLSVSATQIMPYLTHLQFVRSVGMGLSSGALGAV